MQKRSAFTLVEVLISIALLGLILPALYSSVDLLHDSNTQLFQYVEKSKKEIQATQTLYLDIASSDGNLTLRKGEFDRICMERTKNSLYGLSQPKVCWVVLKEGHTLVRIEGAAYHLPLKEEEEIEADMAMNDVELFDIYWKKDKVVVVLKQKKQNATTFMVQGITKPKPKKRKRKKTQKAKKRVHPKPLETQKKKTGNGRTPPSPNMEFRR